MKERGGERQASYLCLALGAWRTKLRKLAVYIVIIISTISWSQSTRLMMCFPTSLACVYFIVTDEQYV